ncbi:MAG: protoporphyrinogen oxidase, partial [Actinomycetota bacterium]|nr:protoporphyrinogen oxidase [Actinomycetota bacterium]
GAPVRGLRRRPGGWRVVVGASRDEEAVDVDAVVLAVPAAPAARLLAGVCPEAARELSEVDYASVAVVTFAFPRAAVAGRLTGSGFLVPPIERRTVKAATYSTNKWHWLDQAAPDLALVRASVGRYGEAAELQRDDAELVAGALADLRAATGVGGTPADSRVTRWGGALPQYTVGHPERMSRVRAAAGRLGTVAVCGAAYDGIGVPACIASASVAVAQVLAGLPARGTIGP